MRIEDYSPGTVKTGPIAPPNFHAPEKSLEALPGGLDRVSLSSLSHAVGGSDSNVERVAELKDQVQAGTYYAAAQQVSSQLTNFYLGV